MWCGLYGLYIRLYLQVILLPRGDRCSVTPMEVSPYSHLDGGEVLEEGLTTADACLSASLIP